MITKLQLTRQDALMTGIGFAGGLALWTVVWPVVVALFEALVPADTKFFWLLTRASGITAYVLLTASMLFGLGVSTRLFDALTPRANSFTLHEYVSWLSLGFTALHAGVLLLDRYQPFTLAEILAPFVAEWRPVETAMGVLGLYTAVLVSVTFSMKPWVSQRMWRLIHYLSFGAWLLAAGHAVLAGSDTSQAWMQWLYLISGAAVLFLTLYRILAAGRPARAGAGERHRTGAQAAPGDRRGRTATEPSSS